MSNSNSQKQPTSKLIIAVEKLESKISKLEKESENFPDYRQSFLSKLRIENEIIENHKIISDPKLAKEFEEFKKTLLNREEFTPTAIEIIDNRLTDEEIENYKVIICSMKYLEGIKLEDGRIIYPNNELAHYRECALDRINWLRHKEQDFTDYYDISNYHRNKIWVRGAWRDIAGMFFNEITFE